MSQLSKHCIGKRQVNKNKDTVEGGLPVYDAALGKM